MSGQGIIGNFLGDYAAERFEIACCNLRIAAADKAGMNDVAAVCRGILAEEEEMAEWVGHRVPLITKQVVDQREARHEKEDQPRRRAASG